MHKNITSADATAVPGSSTPKAKVPILRSNPPKKYVRKRGWVA